MLDWGALVAGESAQETGETGQVLGHCPKNAPTFSGGLGRTESNSSAGCRGNAPNAQNAPSEKQEGEEKTTETGAVGAAVPSNLCAQFSVNPFAVCLVLAYWEKVSGDADELAGALLGLSTMPSAEQERNWALACADAGIDPWLSMHQQSYGEGQECTGCKYLACRTESLPHTRRRFFWWCDLHHQMLEYYQGGERVLIAPPECQSWERWQMSGHSVVKG